MNDKVQIVPFAPQHIVPAGKVMRMAFGTFLGLADPMTFMGDTDYARTRFAAEPQGAFAAEIDGQLVGSVFTSDWGSVGFFGPLTVHPQYWDKGIASQLMEKVISTFERWDIRLAGLFTFPHSNKHLALYQKFGFWPKYLTSLLSKAVPSKISEKQYQLFAALSQQEQDTLLKACARLTDEIYPGMDLSREICSVGRQKLGDTVLIGEVDIVGFAICHAVTGSEAPSGTCYVKFAVVKTGKDAAGHFQELIDAIENFAFRRKAVKIVAGCNAGCEQAFQLMLQHGFVREMQGVIMHKPNEEGFYHKNTFVLNDWR